MVRGSAVALAVDRSGLVLARAGNVFAVRPVVSGETARPMDTPSDRTLAARAVRGDEKAFAELYRRYERPIFNLILRSTGRRAVAEELLQETFTRVWRMGRSFDAVRGEFRPWLYKIAINAVRSELGKKRYAAEHVVLEDAEAEASATRLPDDPAARLDQAARAAHVVRAIEALPIYLKEVVILRCYQQLKFSEIAEIAGVPEGTLKARFHRAVAVLRARLEVGERER